MGTDNKVIKPPVAKIYCFVDETGQDTGGKIFLEQNPVLRLADSVAGLLRDFQEKQSYAKRYKKPGYLGLATLGLTQNAAKADPIPAKRNTLQNGRYSGNNIIASFATYDHVA